MSKERLKKEWNIYALNMTVTHWATCRGGKSTHILYLSKSTTTCVKKYSRKSRSTDSTPLLK